MITNNNVYKNKKLRINLKRLINRLHQLGRVGAQPGGGTSRLALTPEDKLGRNLVVSWMKELDLKVSIDGIGNVVGLREGRQNGAPVMIGSHIDTVENSGIYDGCLGVLAGLEIIELLNELNIETELPLAVAFFTNEEGSRFAPDMMGSMVYTGQYPLEKALATVGICNTTVEDNLKTIGYAGKKRNTSNAVHAFIELHIEQGPHLERENKSIGVVESVQGISWTEITLKGASCHAGTYPMSFRTDVSYVAACITRYVREISQEIGEKMVATTGHIKYSPNLINVVPDKVTMTIDMRNPHELELQKAELMLHHFIKDICKEENVQYSTRKLARFMPTKFDPALSSTIEAKALENGYSTKRMYSPAGHDAQIFANICPSAMIFIPCENGISHSIYENVCEADIKAGAQTLFDVVMEVANAKILSIESTGKLTA
jgi:N-carbamoyl-L-amino-acid hydrolase